MALMKTGRNGEDPKKPKAQGEVKVTAKRPVEPPQKQYTWDDVAKNDAIKERNRAAKQQYESDVASYNKAMKLYNEGASYDDVSEPLSMMNKSKNTVKGKPTTFTAATGGTSAREMSEAYDKGLKSGEYVDINDPRISEKNRYYLKGAMLSGRDNSSNKWGTVKGKAIPASVAFDKDLNFKKIYDGEDFDPYEFEKASKSGKFEEYSRKVNMTGKSFMPSFGYLENYGKPEQAKAPTYEKEENIDVKKLPIEKLSLKPVKLADKKAKLAISEPTAPAEKADWEAPEGSIRYRTKYKTMRTEGRGNETLLGKAKNAGAFIRSKAETIGKDNALSSGLVKTQGKERLIQGKTGREAKMAKAYFSGYEGQSKFDIEGTSEERGAIGKLKASKADLKEGIKAVRKGTAAPSSVDKSDRIAGLRAAKKDVKSEIKQAKLASKYVSKLGQETTGVREGQELRSTGKITTFTPTTMAGFSGSKQDTYDPDANFKSQMSNAANRNTIPAQEKALSFKEKLATEKAERQKAPSFKEKRSIRAEEKKLQRSIKVPNS
jgi:hypothetical protein